MYLVTIESRKLGACCVSISNITDLLMVETSVARSLCRNTSNNALIYIYQILKELYTFFYFWCFIVYNLVWMLKYCCNCKVYCRLLSESIVRLFRNISKTPKPLRTIIKYIDQSLEKSAFFFLWDWGQKSRRITWG